MACISIITVYTWVNQVRSEEQKHDRFNEGITKGSVMGLYQ